MDIFHNLRQYFSFSKKEARDLAITALALGFIFSFRSWGQEVFDIKTGLFSWFNAFLICVLAVLVHILAQKIFALYRGYLVEYKFWAIGIGLGLLFAFLTNGLLYVAIPGIISVSLIEHFRLGKRWQGKLKKDEAMISFTGPFANILLAIVFQGLLNLGLENPLIVQAVLVNKWVAIFSILPIPYLDGFKIFYYSRVWGLFSIIAILSLSVFLSWFGFWQTLLTALILSALFAIVYFIRFEL